MSLNVRVISPDRVVWDAMVEELILPSSTGQLGILVDHAPLLTALTIRLIYNINRHFLMLLNIPKNLICFIR